MCIGLLPTWRLHAENTINNVWYSSIETDPVCGHTLTPPKALRHEYIQFEKFLTRHRRQPSGSSFRDTRQWRQMVRTTIRLWSSHTHTNHTSPPLPTYTRTQEVKTCSRGRPKQISETQCPSRENWFIPPNNTNSPSPNSNNLWAPLSYSSHPGHGRLRITIQTLTDPTCRRMQHRLLHDDDDDDDGGPSQEQKTRQKTP